MNVSQNIVHINENSYEDEITVTDVPNGHFIAVISNTAPAEGSTQREMVVSIMPLEMENQGTQTTNSGLFVKTADETSIKVTVQQDGKSLADNVQSYA
ncbi:MAG: hypothetical protein AAFP19_03620 [Bacteroidota bacterium]